MRHRHFAFGLDRIRTGHPFADQIEDRFWAYDAWDCDGPDFRHLTAGARMLPSVFDSANPRLLQRGYER